MRHQCEKVNRPEMTTCFASNVQQLCAVVVILTLILQLSPICDAARVQEMSGYYLRDKSGNMLQPSGAHVGDQNHPEHTYPTSEESQALFRKSPFPSGDSTYLYIFAVILLYIFVYIPKKIETKLILQIKK
jgi:hypothetical protein